MGQNLIRKKKIPYFRCLTPPIFYKFETGGRRKGKDDKGKDKGK
jgi:hypothetical protein